MTNFSAIILAAGKGTRMKSALPKPLHCIAHKPMLGYAIDAYKIAGAQEIIVVISPDDKLTPALFTDVTFAIQTEQKGTGHAAMTGIDALTKPADKIVIALGDQPFVSDATIKDALAQQDAITVVAMRPSDPAKYGRLITDSTGALLRITEFKDATDKERKINLCNAYPICFDGQHARDLLTKITPNNAASEYYLTDAIDIANQMGLRCGFFEAPVSEALAANTREELAYLETIVQTKLRKNAMDNGATLLEPNSVYFAHDTVIGKDVIIEPNVYFGPNVVIGDNVRIKAFSHIEGTQIANHVEIGPFARLRPETTIGEKARIGNFVEIKKSQIGNETKISHLSYIGDSVIGTNSNIGGGTITCNYDGFLKHTTTIGDNVFIGSNNTLIAPVTIGDNAMTAGGSVINRDVSSDAMAIGRGTQEEKPGWAKAFRTKNQD